MDSNMVVVQYCPCGHTGYMDEEDERIKKQLEDKTRMDAPILGCEDCSYCEEDRKRQDRLNDEMLGDFD